MSTNSAVDVLASSNSTTQAKAANAAAKGAVGTGNSAQEIQNRFLTMLVTQLKNQDPLNPMDNGQVTSQLSQISTVSGIEKLNTSLGQLLDVYNSSQAIQAAGMIGKSAMVSGSQMVLQGGQAVGGVSLSSAADKVSVTVLDASGNVVQTEDLGARPAGVFGFVWDGANALNQTSPDGLYHFKVTATQGGKELAASPLQIGSVLAVTRSGNGFQLDLGAFGTVDFKDVQQIL
ncbi:MAG: flagellar hook assembly protein FlgD [Pseudomonadota bacterium]